MKIFCLPTHLQDVSKMSWRRLQDILENEKFYVLENDKLLHWRHLQEVFKTCLWGEKLFTGYASACSNVSNPNISGGLWKIYPFWLSQ